MEKTTEMGKNAPEKKYSTGAISATIWDNKAIDKEGKSASFKTISLQRRYKDKSGEWKSTAYLRLNDLPKASLVLGKAYEYLILRDSSNFGQGEIDIEDVY